jgi:hypothetical protein
MDTLLHMVINAILTQLLPQVSWGTILCYLTAVIVIFMMGVEIMVIDKLSSM